MVLFPSLVSVFSLALMFAFFLGYMIAVRFALLLFEYFVTVVLFVLVFCVLCLGLLFTNVCLMFGF